MFILTQETPYEGSKSLAVSESAEKLMDFDIIKNLSPHVLSNVKSKRWHQTSSTSWLLQGRDDMADFLIIDEIDVIH